MTKKEMVLAAKCLLTAKNEFSHHCCNDPPESWFVYWTKAEIVKLDLEMNIWNNSPSEHDPENPTFQYCDCSIMGYLASKLDDEADRLSDRGDDNGL